MSHTKGPWHVMGPVDGGHWIGSEEQRLAELIDGARATSEQDVAVLAGECKRARASEARLIEALKGVLFVLDRHEVAPEVKDAHNTEACCICVAQAALKEAES